ncbi:MAG: hypothetical protein WBG50_10550 [Desulfomonilaceae bacterium]
MTYAHTEAVKSEPIRDKDGQIYGYSKDLPGVRLVLISALFVCMAFQVPKSRLEAFKHSVPEYRTRPEQQTNMPEFRVICKHLNRSCSSLLTMIVFYCQWLEAKGHGIRIVVENSGGCRLKDMTASCCRS